MQLEDAIHQQTFRNHFEKAYINIIFTAGHIHNTFRSMFSEYGLTSQQFNVLRILRGSKQPLSTQQIRDRMLDKMSDVSRIVDRLVEKKLVHKSVCAHDRRLLEITITTKGLQILGKLDRLIEEFEKKIPETDSNQMIHFNHLIDDFRLYFSGQ